MGAALLTTVLFSISAVTARRTTAVLHPSEANFWRLCVALIFLAGYSFGLSYGLNPASFHVLFISGVIGFGIGDIALFHAYPKLGSRLTVLLVHCLAAPFAALTEWIWLGVAMSATEIVCATTILFGVVVALAPEKRVKTKLADLAPGIAFGVIGALGQGLGAVLSRFSYELSIQGGEAINGINIAFQRIMGGVIFSGFWLLLLHGKRLFSDDPKSKKTLPSKSPQTDSLKAADKLSLWPWILANAMAGPALGVGCYQFALKGAPSGIVLPIVALTPLVVVPFAMIMKEEHPTSRSLVGGILAVAGVVLLAFTY